MNQSLDTVLQPWTLGFLAAVDKLGALLPRIVGAVLLWFVGVFVAKAIRRVVVEGLNSLRVSALVEKTPLGLFLKNAEIGQKVEEILGNVVYWLLQLVFLQAVVNMLGLVTIANVFERMFGYLPHVVAAFVVFFFGVVLAGVVESVVKGMLNASDPQSARVFAKFSSYVVITVTLLAAVSELGIASEFIRLLFMGVVFAGALGIGLATGLGAQDIVKKMSVRWYDRLQKRSKT
jgi:hypothetical protein